ncbi:helix-turn-helix domain-containing protein [Merdibacter massiliensis]|uniref:hypothetical protein n=1 Tax=Merdibacter massiliensis TaxID=1871030 RepID=UPI00096AA589|nr:hypothetical protein [Merdibacter massiliensis]
MALTETKKRYLLTIALLHSSPQHPFRPIDLAIQLGVSRASVSRMLVEFVKENFLIQTKHMYSLSPDGMIKITPLLNQYHMYRTFYKDTLELPDYEAQECALSMLCSLDEVTLSQVSNQIAKRIS